MKLRFSSLSFVFFIFAIIWVSTPPPALAQKTDMDAFVSEVNVTFPPPPLYRILSDPEGDMWIETTPPPPPNPFSSPTPSAARRPIMDITNVYANSNGVDTWIVVQFSRNTNMETLVSELSFGAILVDLDQDYRTGRSHSFSGPIDSNGFELQFDPRIGYEAAIELWSLRSGRVYAYKTNGDGLGQYFPANLNGQYLEITLSNDFLEEFGDGEMDLAMFIGDNQGVIDIAPNYGYATATAARRVRISPDSSTFTTVQGFDLSIVVETDSLRGSFQKSIFYDGMDVTEQFEATETVSEIAPGHFWKRNGWRDVREGKVFTYHMKPGYMQPGFHTLTVFITASDGFFAHQAEYEVLEAVPLPLHSPSGN